jgi:hypothetical protein
MLQIRYTFVVALWTLTVLAMTVDAAVHQYKVHNVDTGEVIVNDMTHGERVCRPSGNAHMNIQVDIEGQASSVRMLLDGPTSARNTSKSKPFMLYDSGGNMKTGKYTLSAKPDGTGTFVEEQIAFEVVDCSGSSCEL